jgi:hypothetical protein
LETEKFPGTVPEFTERQVNVPPGALLGFIGLYRFLHAFKRNFFYFDEVFYYFRGIVFAFYTGD